jgi:4-amino-4-deoxy-L-arabinose transferase-like glycosyltransferase
MGIAALIRPVALFYPLILLFLLFVFSKQSVSWKIKSSVLYLLIFSCCLGSWAYRNHAEYGRWQLSTEDGSGILMYYAAYTEARITHTNVDSVRIKFQRQADLLGFKNERNTFNQANIYKRVAFDYINKNRKEYIITHLLGGLNMFLALGNTGMAQTLGWDEDKHGETFAEISMKRILSNFTAHKREALLGVLILLVLIIEYAGALYGLLIVWRDKNYLFILLFLLTATYFALTTGVVGTYRYKLPVVPFICIAAGYGYMKLGKTSEKKV